jgi:hypothetical protein
MRYYRGLPPSSYFSTLQASPHKYQSSCNPQTIPDKAIMALLLIPIDPAMILSQATLADPIPQIFQSSTRLTRGIICPPILCPPILCPTIHLSATLTNPLSASPPIIPCRTPCQRILRPHNHLSMAKIGLPCLQAPHATFPTSFRRTIACPRTPRHPTVPGGLVLHRPIDRTPPATPGLRMGPLGNRARTRDMAISHTGMSQVPDPVGLRKFTIVFRHP